MKNQIRTARWYQLAFKNNLQLTNDLGKVALLGSKVDFSNFWRELDKKTQKGLF